jgi:putative PIN family toxin of toxin-antitoxin system
MSSEHKIRVVLDTNVFVAAYWAPESASAKLLRACFDGLLEAEYTPEIKREVTRVLEQIGIDEFFARWIEGFWAIAVETTRVEPDDLELPDPDDRKFIEAVLGAEADFLVTNDHHLLSIGYIGRTEVLTPGSAIRLLGSCCDSVD